MAFAIASAAGAIFFVLVLGLAYRMDAQNKRQAVEIERLTTALDVEKAKRKDAALSVSAEDMLHDLTTRGSAVVRVEVIDAKNLFLRSPRG